MKLARRGKSPRSGLTRIRPHAERHTGAMITGERDGCTDLALWHRAPGSVRSGVTERCKRVKGFNSRLQNIVPVMVFSQVPSRLVLYSEEGVQ